MENLNAETIKKALECCSKTNCKDCPYRKEDIFDITCCINMAKDALSFIKELTEENERLRAENENKCKDCAGCIADKCDCANIEADTVRKMQERLKEHLQKPEFPWDSFTVAEEFIDQVAKEMLEENK